MKQVISRLNDKWPIWAAVVLKMMAKLVRTRIIGLEHLDNNPAAGFAIWHRDEFAMIPYFGRYHCTIMISPSRDGGYFAKAVEYMGYNVVRGSSSRGGAAALVALIRAVRRNRQVILAVDGPQGPRGVCKPGIIKLAQKTGAPVIPVSCVVSWKYVFKKTWHKTYLPLPLARQVIAIGEPFYIEENNDDEFIEKSCRRVEQAIRDVEGRAEKALKEW